MPKWIDLTREDLREYVKKYGDQAVAVLTLGSIEQHGEHLPLGTDYFHAVSLMERISKRDDILVLPALPYTNTEVQMGFPGAISVRSETLVSLLRNICDEIARNGIRKILILPCHGTLRYNIPQFLYDLVQDKKNYVVFAPLLPTAFATVKGVSKESMEEFQRASGHAGAMETSLMLYLQPSLVRKDKIEKMREGVLNPEIPRAIAEVTKIDWSIKYPTGVDGDPTKASKEIGAKIAEAFSDGIEKIIEEIKRVDVDKILLK